MLKGLGPRAGASLRAGLRLRGFDVDRLPAAFPVEEWTPQVRFIATTAFPELPLEAGLRKLGYAYMMGWKDTLMGSAVSSLLRVVGPVRSLPRLDRAFRTANNFTTSKAELLSATSARLHLSDVYGLPTLWQGVLEGGLALINRQGEVQVEDAQPPGVTLFITWR